MTRLVITGTLLAMSGLSYAGVPCEAVKRAGITDHVVGIYAVQPDGKLIESPFAGDKGILVPADNEPNKFFLGEGRRGTPDECVSAKMTPMIVDGAAEGCLCVGEKYVWNFVQEGEDCILEQVDPNNAQPRREKILRIDGNDGFYLSPYWDTYSAREAGKLRFEQKISYQGPVARCHF